MALSGEQLHEARRAAMLEAMERMKGGGANPLCSRCAALEEKVAADGRRFCHEVQHLRKTVQTMLDQLSFYMAGSSLRAFAEALQLDDRIFKIPGELDVQKPPPFPVDAPISQKELAQLKAERDIAKMRLASMNKELREYKIAHEASLKQREVEHGVQRAAVPRPPKRDAAERGRSVPQRQYDAAVTLSACQRDCMDSANTHASELSIEQRGGLVSSRRRGEPYQEPTLARAATPSAGLEASAAAPSTPPILPGSRAAKLVRRAADRGLSQPALQPLGSEALPMSCFGGRGGPRGASPAKSSMNRLIVLRDEELLPART